MHCIELVVYQIKPEASENWRDSQAAMLKDLKQQPGFIEYRSYQATDNLLCFTDQVIWQNKDLALQAFQNFKRLPFTMNFMACIDKVLFSNHFELYTCVKDE
jgi:heme-degrading monooxygenase HmoA